MVAAWNITDRPLGLVVTGEANEWTSALERIVGPRLLTTVHVDCDRDLLRVIQRREAHAAVIDDDVDWGLDALGMLRQVRSIDALFPVVVVTRHSDRRWLEAALRLAAFSVVAKPLELEELLRQIRRIMIRLDQFLRESPDM
ncbi:MAG: hypothetical protein GXY38_09830 [Planctomycetes bacterium]|jgi:DNA-binding NtrC family response regulator|nr:hypothetical protein [Planctomycetota bacterium]